MNTTNLTLPGADNFFVEEAYKVLRTNLQFCGQDVRTIVITSCDKNEGKTVVTLSLGKSFAELGKRVLVIDADMRKSVIAGRNANARNPAGLSEVLTGQEGIPNAVYKTQYEGLNILFAGKYPPNPVELLSGNNFTRLLEQARKVYDYILIDTPPLGRVIDAAVVAPNCDGTIVVIGDSNIRYRQAQEVVSQLRKSGSKILGVVRNNSKNRNSAAYYRKKYKYENEYVAD